MSTLTEVQLDNLNMLKATFTPSSGTAISFECISKDNLPRVRNNATWNVLTDAMQVGKTVVGTSEGLEPITVTIPTTFNNVFTELQKLQVTQTLGTLKLTYDDGTNDRELSIPNVSIIGVEPAGGANNSNSVTTVTFQPTGSIANTNTAAPFTVTEPSD